MTDVHIFELYFLRHMRHIGLTGFGIAESESMEYGKGGPVWRLLSLVVPFFVTFLLIILTNYEPGKKE